MNIFLFGIGGTGARVLRSLTYCLASNMGDFAEGITFVPMIIDHDATNKDKKIAEETLEEYRKISNAIQGERNQSTHDKSYRNFFLPRIKYLGEIRKGNSSNEKSIPNSFMFQFGIDKSNGGGTFDEFIDLEALVGEKAITGDLLKSLYSDQPGKITVGGKQEDNPIAELKLNLDKGYRGNPNIGTVVFNSITKTDSYRYFARNFDADNDIIVIIGSIFGGTGSSGIPKLIEAIRTNEKNELSTAKVACIMVMPYFKVNDLNQTKVTPAIQDEMFKSKQKAALTFYNKCRIGNKSMNDCFDSIYYIAEQDSWLHQNKYSEGGQDQQNNANIVELISAMGIIDFVKNNTDEEGKKIDNKNHPKTLEYGLENDCQIDHSLILDNFYDNNGVFRALTRLTLALKHYRDHILKGGPSSTVTYYGDKGINIPSKKSTDFYKSLEKFTQYYNQWLNELEEVKHSFAPYNFKEETPLKNVVVGYEADDKGFLFFRDDGISYKDFDSKASKLWANGVKNYQNKDEALLKLLFDASEQEIEYLTQTKKKKK